MEIHFTTIRNKKGDIGQPWRTPLQRGNLLELFGYQLMELLIPL